MGTKVFNIGIVGLGFGAEFIPIHQAHPHARLVAVCRRDEKELAKVADAFGVPKRYTSYEAMLKDPEVDAVHINSPIGDHAPQSLRALRAGKHVMCTVPMATTLRECEALCKEVERSGLKYMMAETVAYSREYLFLKELLDTGKLGKLQYLAASHPQDMDGWPAYWQKMVPMHYATHVVSPCLGLAGGRAEYVSCFGSGTVRADIRKKSGSGHAVQSCHIKIQGSDLSAHIWRCLYDVARQYRESIDVYGTKRSFEWTLTEGHPHVLHTAKKPEHQIAQPVKVPDYAHRLPKPLRKFTQSIQDAGHLSFVQGGGHGGSHPHMVHEFISALVEDRDPWPNATTAANWTCVGICAHESARRGGKIVPLPPFTLR